MPEWLGRVGRKLVPAGVKLAEGVHLSEGCHKSAGALLRARLLESDGVTADLELSGDIDCCPADGLEAPAQQLRGAPLDDRRLVDTVSSAMERYRSAGNGGRQRPTRNRRQPPPSVHLSRFVTAAIRTLPRRSRGPRVPRMALNSEVKVLFGPRGAEPIAKSLPWLELA
jgi:hypothetical protein